MKPSIADPAALEEFAEAVSFYDLQREGLGAAFRNHVADAVQRPRANPLHSPPHQLRGFRKQFFPPFPYALIFREFPTHV
jgi:hypothetical protein